MLQSSRVARILTWGTYGVCVFVKSQPVADPVCVRPTLPNMSNAVQELRLRSGGSASLAQLLGKGYHLTCNAVQTLVVLDLLLINFSLRTFFCFNQFLVLMFC